MTPEKTPVQTDKPKTEQLSAQEMLEKALNSKFTHKGKEITIGDTEYKEIKNRMEQKNFKVKLETLNQLINLAETEWPGLATKLEQSKDKYILQEAKPEKVSTENSKQIQEGMSNFIDKQDYNPKKLDKMIKTPENMLRGSVELHIAQINEIKKMSEFTALNNIKVPTHGDLHLEQLIFVNGQPKLSDFDESHMNGSALNDILRVIESIKISGGNPEQIKAFMTNYKSALNGTSISLPDIPKGIKINTNETQDDLVNGTNTFINFKDGLFQGDKVKHIEESVKTSITTELNKIGITGTILDGKIDPSSGVGSFGMEKISVAVQIGENTKIYELKEQSKDHSANAIDGNHTNEERSEFAAKLGDSTKTITLDGKNYTVSEIIPNYSKFDVKGKDKSGNDETSARIDYASTFFASELAKLHGDNKEAILRALNEDTTNKLLEVGTSFADNLKSYQETKLDQKQKEDIAKVNEIISKLGNTDLTKYLESIKGLKSTYKEEYLKLDEVVNNLPLVTTIGENIYGKYANTSFEDLVKNNKLDKLITNPTEIGVINDTDLNSLKFDSYNNLFAEAKTTLLTDVCERLKITVSGDISTNADKIREILILNYNNSKLKEAGVKKEVQVKQDIAEKIVAANNSLKDSGYEIRLTSGYRTPELQELLKSNDANLVGQAVADGRFVDGKNSPALTGCSINIALFKDGKDEPLKINNPEAKGPDYQGVGNLEQLTVANRNLVIKAMLEQGFMLNPSDFSHFSYGNRMANYLQSNTFSDKNS